MSQEVATVEKNKVFVSRRHHDIIFEKNRRLLLALFDGYKRSWGIGGVTFYNVNERHCAQIKQVVGIIHYLTD
jgi:hypothetical protein